MLTRPGVFHRRTNREVPGTPLERGLDCRGDYFRRVIYFGTAYAFVGIRYRYVMSSL